MSKKIKKIILPGTFLMVSSYFSVLFTIGAVLAYVITEFLLRKFLKAKKIRQMIFNLGGWEIHIHHWVFAILIIIATCISNFLLLPSFFAGILSGLIFHDIYTDKKWYRVIIKKPASF